MSLCRKRVMGELSREVALFDGDLGGSRGMLSTDMEERSVLAQGQNSGEKRGEIRKAPPDGCARCRAKARQPARMRPED